MAAEYSLFESLGVVKEYKYLAASIFTGSILVATGFYVRSKAYKLASGDALPEPKFSVFNLMVEVLQYFRKLLKGMIGHDSDRYLGIIATTFVLIFLSNFMGIFPGLLSSTSSLNNNLAMGLFVFASYQYFGFREHGIGYLKQFMGGMPVKNSGALMFVMTLGIGLFLFCLEIFSHTLRPATLSLRLWGVINGDHTLVQVVGGMVPLFVPILALGLGLIVCLVQALVFTLLSSVYIQMAVSHDH